MSKIPNSNDCSEIEQHDAFVNRHIGSAPAEIEAILAELGFADLDLFSQAVVPEQIRLRKPLELSHFAEGSSEVAALARLEALAARNHNFRSYLGMGFQRSETPAVIQRNILENPGWYTHYTPYQAEIAQGRLEALFNFQTLICELTGLEIANASLLDEGSAAAEALGMAWALASKKSQLRDGRFAVAADCHPATVAVLKTRAAALGIELAVVELDQLLNAEDTFGILLQYPGTYGALVDLKDLLDAARQRGVISVVACDLLALTLVKPPGELGADIAIGSAQRFGMPLGAGGPAAAFLATRSEYKRLLPGRLVGISKDAAGRAAYRLALQTREQHIRREKATSNICTAQVLPAVVAALYAVYHGPVGLRRIAKQINRQACRLAAGLKALGFEVLEQYFFDTVLVRQQPEVVAAVTQRAKAAQLNLRIVDQDKLSIALDQSCSDEDLAKLLWVFAGESECGDSFSAALEQVESIPAQLKRQSAFLQQAVFNRYHCETEFLRYIRRLESYDLSLGTAMIPLGSCTMKLNPTAALLPLTWRSFADLHPFAPLEQLRGYQQLIAELEQSLNEITGFAAVTFQPNAGSQGEYCGLLMVQAYHRALKQEQRNICLIPRSAHGTNPASAVLAGFEVVTVECSQGGGVSLDDLAEKVKQYGQKLAVLMVTYPSTHGVFEAEFSAICELVHQADAQVYVDGANMNALVGLTRIADLGADLCHFNLHKTFGLPHGGGGPGVGPVGVKSHLVPFLPGHPQTTTRVDQANNQAIGPVSSGPWGNANLLPIAWVYLALLGSSGVTTASQVAILNANYLVKRLNQAYPVLYRDQRGFVAHECIIDLRQYQQYGIEVDDVAKRLMDYGFHAPTVSWPIPGTMMVEPTESESKAELDRFCDAMLAIKAEIDQITAGAIDRHNNPLKNAPHCALDIAADNWDRPYSREQAAFPSQATREFKYWPKVGRIDNVFGDRAVLASSEYCCGVRGFAPKES